MARYATLIIASAVLSFPSCLALVDTISVSATGVSATVLTEPFGLAAGGYMNFDVEPSDDARCVPVSTL